MYFGLRRPFWCSCAECYDRRCRLERVASSTRLPTSPTCLKTFWAFRSSWCHELRCTHACQIPVPYSTPRGRQRGNKSRIRFWNIAGTIGGVRRQGVEEGWDSGVLEGAEVLVLKEKCFDNTAHEAEVATWCQEQGRERVVCNIRPYDHQHGGVAVFVKRGQRAAV